MNRELTIRIKNNSYTVKFPTVGQFSDIEIRKQLFSGGNYGSMVANMTSQSQRALDIIDAQAYFTILIPELIKDLNVKSLRDIDLLDFEEIRIPYVKKFAPWVNEWEDALKTVDDSKTDDK